LLFAQKPWKDARNSVPHSARSEEAEQKQRRKRAKRRFEAQELRNWDVTGDLYGSKGKWNKRSGSKRSSSGFHQAGVDDWASQMLKDVFDQPNQKAGKAANKKANGFESSVKYKHRNGPNSGNPKRMDNDGRAGKWGGTGKGGKGGGAKGKGGGGGRGGMGGGGADAVFRYGGVHPACPRHPLGC
jgi:hypothetical protein